MLIALHGKASERKMWLFACAYCQLTWHLLPELCHRLVEAVERYADKEAKRSELRALFDGYKPHQVATSALPGGNQAAEAVGHLGWHWRWGTSTNRDHPSLYNVSRSAAESLAKSMPWQEARHMERQLLLDIFANPFRPVRLDPTWLTWHDGTVQKVAQAIYDERAFDRLPILADALEEAGCTNADILNHCRQPGDHVRGCWVVDMILGKS
jgi:hypothetical protein